MHPARRQRAEHTGFQKKEFSLKSVWKGQIPEKDFTLSGIETEQKAPYSIGMRCFLHEENPWLGQWFKEAQDDE